MTQQKKEKITNAIMALILLCYPLRKMNIGLDMMDAGYALGNYRFFDSLNEMWKLATYLANVTGVMLSHLPYGDTWLGMNVYTALLIGLTAACSYLFLSKRFANKYKWLLFIGEIAALSLCWAPSVLLYQYMGYFAMTAAVLLLYKALTENNNKCYVIAGIILGAAVYVRMPNITYMALIFPVWFYGWLQKDKFSDVLRQTMYCIAGYLTGFLIPLVVICVRYGMDAYPNMITSLFGITDTATDYKPVAMIYAMFEDYIRYSIWLLLFILYLLFGIVLFKLAQGRFDKLKKILYLFGMAVLLRLCYGRGMFGLDYTSYFAMYKWVTVYLLVVIGLCIYLLLSHKMPEQYKLWAAFLLVILFITPLGGNNGLYYLMNNLFVIAPVSVCILWDVIKTLTKEKLPEGQAFVWKSMIIFVLAGTFVQSFLFGIGFVFHDALPKGEQYVKIEITGSDSTKGLYTTVDKKAQLEALGGYLSRNQLTDRKVLLYGDIPAISYIFDMESAVYTTWADLASNTLERLEADIDSITQDYPVVIVTEETGNELDRAQQTSLQDPKLAAISALIQRGNYSCTYAEKGYCVYTTEY